MEIRKINIGCGRNYRKGYINIDINKKEKVDKIVDLNKKLPFESNSIFEVYCWNVLEHIKNFKELMEEIYRILKPGGIFIFRVPIAGTIPFYMSPDHITTINPYTMILFTNKSKAPYFKSKCKFKIKKLNVTTPLIHIKFPYRFFLLNSVINNLFTGIEGIFEK